MSGAVATSYVLLGSTLWYVCERFSHGYWFGLGCLAGLVPFAVLAVEGKCKA